MPLRSCIECRQPVSDSAGTCPSCSTLWPFGVACELCGRQLPRSSAVAAVRHERDVKRSDSRDDSWYVKGSIDHHIYAHPECLSGFYTPPPTLTCADCGETVSSEALGLDALSLWSNSSAAHFRCPRCGYQRTLRSDCQWAGRALYTDAFLHTPFGAPPCMRPLYEFQTGASGRGHGQHDEQDAVEERANLAVQAKASADKAFRAQLKKERTPENVWLGGMNGGVLGFVVGFFSGCTTEPMSLDLGIVFGTVVVCVVLGAVAGYMISQSGE